MSVSVHTCGHSNVQVILTGVVAKIKVVGAIVCHGTESALLAGGSGHTHTLCAHTIGAPERAGHVRVTDLVKGTEFMRTASFSTVTILKHTKYS